MVATTNDITPLKKIFLNSEKLSWKTYLLSGITLCLLFILSYGFGLGLFVLFAITGVGCIWIMLHYPKIWIYCVVIGCAIFFQQTQDDVDAVDIFAAVLFNFFFIIWFTSKLLVKTEKKLLPSFFYNSKLLKVKEPLHVTKLSEKLFLLFFAFLIAHSTVTYFNNIPLTDWVREFTLLTLMLYFFPIREYIDTKRSIVTFLVLFGLVILFLDCKQFYNCYLVFKKIEYTYQAGGTVRINQAIYSVATLSGIIFYFFCNSKKSKIYSFIIVSLSMGALITTFSRVYWLALVVCVLFLLIFLNYKQILQLFLIAVLSLGLMFFTLDTFLPQQSSFIQKFVTKRFSSSTKGRKDVSVRTRLDEMKVVNEEIKKSPLVGHGLRSKFSFYFVILEVTVTNNFIHNGYLYLTHKTGIPMAALFYLSLILFTLRSFIVTWKLKRCRNSIDKNAKMYHDINLYIALAIVALVSLLMIFITNFATSSFVFRDGLMVIAISIAFISIAEKQLKIITEKNEVFIFNKLLK